MARKTEEDESIYYLYWPRDLAERVKNLATQQSLALKEKRTIKDILLDAISRYLEEEEKK
jgi:hypothetical protein